MFLVRKEMSPQDVSFTHPKQMKCLKAKKRDNNHFWGYILLYLPPYNSNYRYFIIKPLMTLN